MNKAVFLDRDGTINVERDYLFRCQDFEFIPGVPEAIKALNDAGYCVVVVTNQSGVARGYYEERDVETLHHYVTQQLAAFGARVDGYYYCPHHPEKGRSPYVQQCDCRKGQPGMLLQAAADLDIDFSQSWMVGDKLADIEAANASGCTPILVRTGHGEQEEYKIDSQQVVICDDLSAAVEIILDQECCEG